MNTDFLTRLLAGIFETFKTKNPKLAALILLLLSVVQYVAEQGSAFGLFLLPDWLAQGLSIVSWVLTALVGTSTFAYLGPEGQAKRKGISG